MLYNRSYIVCTCNCHYHDDSGSSSSSNDMIMVVRCGSTIAIKILLNEIARIIHVIHDTIMYIYMYIP